MFKEILLLIIIVIIIWQSQSKANPCALIGSFSVRTLQYGPFPWKRSNPCIFVLERSRQIQNLHFTIRNRVPYNKQLTNRACSSRTGEYWPSVVAVRTSLRSVRTATTSGQYCPVRPSRSVSKRLLLKSYEINGVNPCNFFMTADCPEKGCCLW